MQSARRHLPLALVLLAATAARIGYVLAQPATDPDFSRPMLDGAYFFDWARSLASGHGGPGGAFYLAPLYPYLLAGFVRLFGESFALLYIAQHLFVVASAALLAGVARRASSERAGLFAAAILVLYHPSLFFASRPLGEDVALLVLALSLRLAVGDRRRDALLSGLAGGLASAARPNLLLVPAAWIATGVLARRRVRAAILAAGVALAVLPVAIHNLKASGHLVLLSSNSGITLYHGNGPGANGIFSRPPGFSGAVATQREDATAVARERTGSPLDDVEADGYWRREAVRARLADPVGTLGLAGRRLLLLVDNAEHGLDYAPALDENPWRWAAPLPFAVLLALAGAGLALSGVRGSGGATTWGAILACAATPWIFYASSRYRLPMAALLSVPAGCGVSALASGWGGIPRRRLLASLGVATALALGSFLVPSSDLGRIEIAGALANRSVGFKLSGALGKAEKDARRAIAIDPSAPLARFNLGVVLEAGGRRAEAEKMYRDALSVDPGNADAAGNLSRILIDRHAEREAVPILERALAREGRHAVCWTNLVVAEASIGDVPSARRSAEAATKAGVRLDPGMLRALGFAPERSP